MELEIKLSARPDIPGGPDALFGRLRELPALGGCPLGAVTEVAIRDVYYDTPTGALSRARCALRLRVEDGRPLVTLKAAEVWTGAGLARREEYEAPLTGASLAHVLRLLAERSLVPRPALAAVRQADFAAGRPAGPLSPILDTTTRRWNRPVLRPGGGAPVATLCLDRVEYAGLPGQAFYDVEVEVTGDGREQELAHLSAALQAESEGLAPSAESKLVRGLRLLGRM